MSVPVLDDNVIWFPCGKFTLLNGYSDGWYVLFSFGEHPVEAIGGFKTASDALAWATETGAREGVLVDSRSFATIGGAV